MLAIERCSSSAAVRSASFKSGAMRKLSVWVLPAGIGSSSRVYCKCAAMYPNLTLKRRPGRRAAPGCQGLCCYYVGREQRWREASVGNSRGLPESREPGRIERRVAHGVLDLLVPEVVLDDPQVAALVGEVIAAAVPQQMRVRL